MKKQIFLKTLKMDIIHVKWNKCIINILLVYYLKINYKYAYKIWWRNMQSIYSSKLPILNTLLERNSGFRKWFLKIELYW